MLIDTTLREGAQLFGAYFNTTMKEAFFSGLVALGVDEMETGWVGQDGLEEFVAKVRNRTGSTRLSVWTPCRDADIRAAAELGVDRVNIGVPVSDLHIEQRLKTDREGLKERLAHTVLAAGLLGIGYISVGLEDVSRADPAFALEVACLAQDTGASRVRLADSLGVLTPLETADLVQTFRSHLDIDLAVHCHDDFGMGTANALTALKSGADYADCSVLGIGERSGIAATEELAAYLSIKEEAMRTVPKGFVISVTGCPKPPEYRFPGPRPLPERISLPVNRASMPMRWDGPPSFSSRTIRTASMPGAPSRWAAKAVGRPLPTLSAKAGFPTGNATSRSFSKRSANTRTGSDGR